MWTVVTATVSWICILLKPPKSYMLIFCTFSVISFQLDFIHMRISDPEIIHISAPFLRKNENEDLWRESGEREEVNSKLFALRFSNFLRISFFISCVFIISPFDFSYNASQTALLPPLHDLF